MQDNLRLMLLLSSLDCRLEQLRFSLDIVQGHLDKASKQMQQIKDDLETKAILSPPVPLSHFGRDIVS